MMRFLSKAPFIRLLLPALAGILLQINSPLPDWIVAVSITTALLALIYYHLFVHKNLKFIQRHYTGIFLNLFFFALGLSLVSARNIFEMHHHYSGILEPGDQLMVRLSDAPIQKPNC